MTVEDVVSLLLFRVIPSVMVAALLGYLALRYCNWFASSLCQGEHRSPEINAYLNAVEEREWQPNVGGTMGFPFLRRGKESLRIEPRGRFLQVVRRREDQVMARFEVEDPEVADHVFGLLRKQLEEPTAKSEESDSENIRPPETGSQEVIMQFRDGSRQLFVLRSRGQIKVADVRSGKLQGAAVVASVVEGCELLAVLSCKDAAQLATHRQQMKKLHAEPLVAGAEEVRLSGFAVQQFGLDADDHGGQSQEFDRRFS